MKRLIRLVAVAVAFTRHAGGKNIAGEKERRTTNAIENESWPPCLHAFDLAIHKSITLITKATTFHSV